MSAINVMVNGLPGNVAVTVAKHIHADDRLNLIPFSLTGPEIEYPEHVLDGVIVKLVRPDIREKEITTIKARYPGLISVDYTHPTAVNDNAAFYCRHGLPFVMGTTGGDRALLLDTVTRAALPAVIAPNMAKQIVGLQAIMEYAAREFPGLFSGYSLEVKESHQQGKADTSGTAKAMVQYFNKMGISFSANDIIMERDPKKQKTEWGVPEEYIKGHAWHTYTLISKDKTVKFAFTHNVNGRDVYALGTVDAILFLQQKIKACAAGKVYSMIDVLRGK
ncbi:MAG: dihydrodipicolinate reductase [Desulfobacterales bacterium]|jgi:4-hydroxy-tetrahydrodipicolinate reductase|nr:dihydrodipicolinate reductase [Desulfobacterales bacterium]